MAIILFANNGVNQANQTAYNSKNKKQNLSLKGEMPAETESIPLIDGFSRDEVEISQAQQAQSPYGKKINTDELKDHIIKNNFKNRLKIGMDKFANAITVHPAKGLRGDKNSTFYEFLNMGSVPYVVGSALLMAPALLSKAFAKTDKNGGLRAAKVLGPMALGVLLFGLLKEASKDFIRKPVKWSTGVDVELPYKKIVYELPKNNEGKSKVAIEYHKVFESVDFPRTDLLYNYNKYGNEYGSYYDHIADKMGIGENLEASDQVMKPILKKLVTKERTAETWSSYLWAILGVALAFQNPVKELFGKPFGSNKSLKQHFSLDNIKQSLKSAWNVVSGSAKALHKTGYGKVLIYGALASTLIGNIVTLSNNKPKKPDKQAQIDYSKDYTVN